MTISLWTTSPVKETAFNTNLIICRELTMGNPKIPFLERAHIMAPRGVVTHRSLLSELLKIMVHYTWNYTDFFHPQMVCSFWGEFWVGRQQPELFFDLGSLVSVVTSGSFEALGEFCLSTGLHFIKLFFETSSPWRFPLGCPVRLPATTARAKLVLADWLDNLICLDSLEN